MDKGYISQQKVVEIWDSFDQDTDIKIFTILEPLKLDMNPIELEGIHIKLGEFLFNNNLIEPAKIKMFTRKLINTYTIDTLYGGFEKMIKDFGL